MRITKIGIPPGGDTNQVLVKSSGTDYDVEWGTGSGTATPPGGTNTQVQFNDGGVFGGDAGFTYNKTTNRLTLGSLVLNDVVDPGVDTDKFLVLTSLGVVSYRTGSEVLADIGLTNPVTGTGSSGQVAYWNGTNTITGESNLFWDAGNNRLGLGVTPDSRLHIQQVDETYTGGIKLTKSAGTITYSLVTGGDDGLYLGYSTTKTGTPTDRLILSATGKLGLGVTPSAWDSSLFKAFQIGNRASVFTFNNVTSDFGNNAYYGSGDYRYIESAAASFYRQSASSHLWYTAPSGTAGNAITFTQAMTLTANGDLIIGSGADTGESLQVTGDAKISTINNATTDTDRFLVSDSGVIKYRTGAQLLSDIGASGLGGSTGSIDNAILRADGTGGSTLQSSSVIIDDNANLTLGTSSLSGSRTISVASSFTDADLDLRAKGAGRIDIESSGFIDLTSIGSNIYRTNIQKNASTIGNTVIYPLNIFTYGFSSFISGIGTGIRFEVNTSSINNEIGATIDCVCTDTTAASEDFDIVFNTMAAGLGASEKVRITSTGILNLSQGQIQFPAVQNASSNVNTLDDYEEGVWTPTLIAVTTNFTSVTYDSRTTGTYTKIGNTVFINGVMWTDAVNKGSGGGAAAGNIAIGGLPFTTSATNGKKLLVNVADASAWLADEPLSGASEDTTTRFILYKRATSNGATTPVVVADVNTTADDNIAYFQGFYSI